MAANIHLNFNLQPVEIRALCQKVIDADIETLDKVASLKESELNEESVLQMLSVHSAQLGPLEDNVGFLKFVHPDKHIREVSSECEKRLSEHNVEMQMRKDVFDNLLKLQQSAIGQALEGESRRYLDRLVKNGEKNGLHLDEEKRRQIKEIKKRLSDISITFEDNVNEENTKFTFTRQQLQGVPEDFLKARVVAKDGGGDSEDREAGTDEEVYVVSLKYPDYFPVMKLCVVPETRKTLQTGFDSRCKDKNVSILEEAVQLRAKRAKLLGYSCHADYVLDLRMAKKQENVQRFLEDLSVKLKPLVEKEFEQFLQYKKQDALQHGFHFDGSINMWDFRFYMNKVAQLQYSVDHEKLKGVPEDFLKARVVAKDGGGDSEDREAGTDEEVYVVSLKYPDYFPVMKLCVVPETRKTLQTGFDSRCKDKNVSILEEAVQLRAKRAKLLGYSCHADYVLDLRMAKKQENVQRFLEDLSVKLKPLVEKEFEQFLQYKKQDALQHGFHFDGSINMWDFRFYMNKVAQLQYSVDHEKLKEYFPVDVVTAGLLEIYQSLLHLTFHLVEGAPVWHPDVTLYEAREADDESQIAGYFYLDLYPREGKYNHAAVFKLQGYYQFPDGSLQYPVCAMVANFPEVSGDVPALFTHDDVETFFHEFGHVMHNVCARAQFELFAGTRVERDFVEAPSQMLENWVWNREALEKMSRHYKDGSPIPEELLHKLVQSRKANAGIFNLRQVMLSAFDQTIHVKDQSDVTADYFEMCDRYMGVPATPGTCMPASFDHLMGGYDAQYYGYLWSEVYSADMFESRFGVEGVLNPETGLSYRNCILKPGGSKDAIDMLRDFLGREPNSNAFLKSKGLQPEGREDNAM